MRTEIDLVRAQLLPWSERQPEPIRSLASTVHHGLSATLIGTKPNRKTVEMLRDDVAELARARGLA